MLASARTPRKGYEGNHLKTVGDDGSFVYFRLYVLEQPFFDKSFQLRHMIKEGERS